MKLNVKRIFKGDAYTIGKLYIDDLYFSDTLEDTVRIVNGDCSLKIFGQTAIPEGTYKIEIIYWEKHLGYYPHLLDVPCFSGIMMHGGNTAEDTEGCILVGVNSIKGQLTTSHQTFLT